jgi:hypothetical protein
MCLAYCAAAGSDDGPCAVCTCAKKWFGRLTNTMPTCVTFTNSYNRHASALETLTFGGHGACELCSITCNARHATEMETNIPTCKKAFGRSGPFLDQFAVFFFTTLRSPIFMLLSDQQIWFAFRPSDRGFEPGGESRQLLSQHGRRWNLTLPSFGW